MSPTIEPTTNPLPCLRIPSPYLTWALTINIRMPSRVDTILTWFKLSQPVPRCLQYGHLPHLVLALTFHNGTELLLPWPHENIFLPILGYPCTWMFSLTHLDHLSTWISPHWYRYPQYLTLECSFYMDSLISRLQQSVLEMTQSMFSDHCKLKIKFNI